MGKCHNVRHNEKKLQLVMCPFTWRRTKGFCFFPDDELISQKEKTSAKT